MVRSARMGMISTITHNMHKKTQQNILGKMVTDSRDGEDEADVTAMSSAVAHQKKAVNYWNYIIAGGIVALVLFFVLLGCVIAKLIPKEKKLTEQEEVAREIA